MPTRYQTGTPPRDTNAYPPPPTSAERLQEADSIPISVQSPVTELTTGASTTGLREEAQTVGLFGEEKGTHWSIPWGDLMMVMFVLFAVLVTLQMRENQRLVKNAERQQEALQRQEVLLKEQEEREAESNQRQEIKQPPLVLPNIQPLMEYPSFEPLMRIDIFERSQDAVRETRIDNVEIVLLEDDSVKVSVQGPVFFELGEAVLRPQVTAFLDRLGGVIEQTPYAIEVIGHTDDHPVDTEIFPSNWELSAARAARVARYLIDAADIDPRRFTVMGRGEYEPAVANTSDANRALNRRVEIIITRDIVESTQTTE